MSVSVGRFQKRLLILLSLMFTYAFTHVSSDLFVWSQGFPLAFDWGSDAMGPSNFNVWLLTADFVIATVVLVSVLLLWHPNKAIK